MNIALWQPGLSMISDRWKWKYSGQGSRDFSFSFSPRGPRVVAQIYLLLVLNTRFSTQENTTILQDIHSICVVERKWGVFDLWINFCFWLQEQNRHVQRTICSRSQIRRDNTEIHISFWNMRNSLVSNAFERIKADLRTSKGVIGNITTKHSWKALKG